MGTAFPLLSYGENAWELLKMHFAVQKDVSLTLKYGTTRWRPPRAPLGELTTLPRPLSRLGRGHPSQTPTRSAPSALRFSRLRRSILAFPFLLIYEMTTVLSSFQHILNHCVQGLKCKIRGWVIATFRLGPLAIVVCLSLAL